MLHFGTHGALEFMPGKQAGMTGECWPDRLIGDLPNFYLYAANNPSEGMLAKRRSAATLVSYLTPPLTKPGSTRAWSNSRPRSNAGAAPMPTSDERGDLAEMIGDQCAALDLDGSDIRRLPPSFTKSSAS